MPQRVDPFIPIGQRKPAATPSKAAKRTTPKLAIDGIVPAKHHSTPITAQHGTALPPKSASAPQSPDFVHPRTFSPVSPTPAAPTRPTASADPKIAWPAVQTPLRTPPGKHKLLHWLKWPCMAIGLLFVLFLIQSLLLGEVLAGLYAVYALVRRVNSRITFLLAVGLLIGLIILLVLAPDASFTENVAVYIFLLLVIGAISLSREAST